MKKLKTELVVSDEVRSMINTVRGLQVILDSDLAELYGVLTGNLNKAVKRNINRFPNDFMFQLTQEEYENLKFQFGTSKWGGIRKLPFGFTHQLYFCCFKL
ncbi:ORF6N domain-containing protein [Candidatus Woesearchaeota archaeon]|nr:ORF6N domain-containing protein [Candidatus Woesearchaeota archaeon]